MKSRIIMQTAAQVEPGLLRKLEDLTNELAYIQAFPERFSAHELQASRLLVLQKIRSVRWMLSNWAMPIELVEPASLPIEDFMGWIIPGEEP